jgi:DNA-binding transcriptional LysR family regulator
VIDPRRLGVLQAVAVHGSVAGAASALHLSPPAVSQQLLALERETGACS